MSSVGPRQAAVFVLDCSKSMAVPRSLTEGSGEYERTRMVPPVEVMLQYVRAKIAQRILRDLATTPLAVVTYAVDKTANCASTLVREKLGEAYDENTDYYRSFYEQVPWGQANSRMLSQLANVEAGLGPDVDGNAACADILTAIAVGTQTLFDHPKVKNYTKEVYLLTDGESETEWAYLKATVAKMNEHGISLTVIGFNFDDDEVNFIESDKSDIKRTNEAKLHKLVNALLQPSIIATASRALDAIAQPAVKETRSLVVRTTLTLGDVKTYPDRSLLMHVDIKKATTTAPVKSMKKMSLHGFAKRGGTGQASQLQPPPPSNTAAASQGFSQSQHLGASGSTKPSQLPQQGESSQPRAYSMGNVGRTLKHTLEEAGLELPDDDEDLASHGVEAAKSQWYRPIGVVADTLKSAQEAEEARDKGEQKPEEGEMEEEVEEWRPVGQNASLINAHSYGGTLVDTGDMEQGTGLLSGNELGMQIVGFMKKSKVRYDWRMGDALYVYGSPGQTGSQLLFSAFVNGMSERKSVAVVRYVAKGMQQNGVFRVPDPKMGILWPETSETGLEFCYWCAMPYAEDIRAILFPSLTNLFNRHGERLEEHRLLPTPAQNEAMSAFVDAMDLSEAGPLDEEGNPTSWFQVEDSFSPAIHNIQNTLVFRLSNPEGDLPPVPESIVKYLEPPQKVVENAEQASAAAIAAFNVQRVIPKPKNITKKQTRAGEEEVEFGIFEPSAAEPVPRAPSGMSQVAQADRMQVDRKEDEAVEEGEEDSSWVDVVRPKAASPKNLSHSPTLARMATGGDAGNDSEPVTEDEPVTEEEEPLTEDEDVEMAPAPASISIENPLGDFARVLRARGAEVAVKGLVEAAEMLVARSFSTANYALAMQCLQEARRTASTQVPQVYNDALRSLVRKTVKSMALKRDFGARIKEGGVGLVLAAAGKKGATEKEARLFVEGL